MVLLWWWRCLLLLLWWWWLLSVARRTRGWRRVVFHLDLVHIICENGLRMFAWTRARFIWVGGGWAEVTWRYGGDQKSHTLPMRCDRPHASSYRERGFECVSVYRDSERSTNNSKVNFHISNRCIKRSNSRDVKTWPVNIENNGGFPSYRSESLLECLRRVPVSVDSNTRPELRLALRKRKWAKLYAVGIVFLYLSVYAQSVGVYVGSCEYVMLYGGYYVVYYALSMCIDVCRIYEYMFRLYVSFQSARMRCAMLARMPNNIMRIQISVGECV